MGKIDRYILKSMMLPAFFGVSLFTFIFLIDVLVEMMEKIIVRNIPVSQVIEMVSYYLPPIIVNTMPMGIFLGVMMTYSTLSSNSEIVALESVGVGLGRVLRPALYFGFLSMLFIFFVSEKVIPSSYSKLAMLTQKIAMTKPTVQISEKVFVEGIGDYSIYINKIDDIKNEATNLIAFKKDDDKIYPEIIVSEKAKWKKENMILEKAKFYNISSSGEKELEGSFDKQIIPITTLMGDFTKDREKDKSMMGISEIYKEIKDRKKRGLETIKYEIEFNQMLAIPISAFILSILGVLLSVKHTRGGKGVSFGISLVIIFSYIMGVNLCRLLSNKEVLTPYISLWIPDILLLLVTIIVFIRKVRRGR